MLLRQPAAQAIAWALLQFLWQGALIGALTGLTLVSLRRSAADVRYVVAAIGLSLMLTMPVVTAVQAWRGLDPPRESARRIAVPAIVTTVASGVASTQPRVEADPANDGSAGPAQAVRQPALIDTWLPVLLTIWLLGVAILSLRLLSGWLWVQRLKSVGTGPAREAWQVAAAKLRRRLHIRRSVRLLESTRVDVPTVIGWLKPVVLLPTSAMSGLAPHQLEAILAHELAHIRRHDYFVNLLQTLVETLLFYHPAVWWLSHRIRVERENCCDDLAVSLCGDPYTYAQALAELEGLRGSSGMVVAVTGGSLVERVRRLLGAPSHAGRCPGWLAGTAAVLLVAGMAAGAVGRDLAVEPQTQSAVAPDPALEPQATPGVTPVAPAGPTAPTTAGATRQPSRESADLQAALASLQPLLSGLEPVIAGLGPALASLQPALASLEPVLNGLHPALAALQPALASLQPALASLDSAALQEIAREMEARAREMARQMDDAHAALALEAEARAREMTKHLNETRAALAVREPAMEALAISQEPVLAAIEEAARSLEAHSGAALARAEVALGSVAEGLATQDDRSQGNFSWSDGKEKLEVNYRGTIEFTDDDTDVKSLSPGGWLRIKDGRWIGSRTVEFTADSAGTISRRYWVGSSERPFEPDGRQWLAQALPRFIRQTGLGAPARVARILRTKGVPGVLAEISLINGSWAKRLYFTELLQTATLDGTTAAQVLAQAGREIDSDFELASLLIASADRLLLDDQSRGAYFDAARSIDSDFEMRRVYSSVLKRGPVAPDLLTGLLEAGTSIESDFELASLLVSVVKAQPLDDRTRAPFFKALGTVESDFEHRRVLTALARTNPDDATTGAMLESAASIGSDFEQASLLTDIAKQRPIEGSLRAPFFKAVDGLESSFERGRVLKAVASQSDSSPDTVLAVLRAVRSMDSSFEASQVLLAVARHHELSGPARDAYVEAADRLGNFEQNQVLAALVRRR
jgi:beta-lactamase regulating signal transducer with metallopeptidase domain